MPTRIVRGTAVSPPSHYHGACRGALRVCRAIIRAFMAFILVVEDEADLQQILAYNLRQAGHDVVTASNGEAALAQVRQRVPDLIVLDLMLPGMSGTDVCRT